MPLLDKAPTTREYKYSFSGADCDVYAMYSDRMDLIWQLESLHTVSISVHEAKGPARALGHRGIKGLSKGVRTIAGSMIFTVVNRHPLADILQAYPNVVPVTNWKGWSVDRDLVGVGSWLEYFRFTNRLVTLLPPLTFLAQYASETANYQKVQGGEGGLVERDLGGEFLESVLEIDGAGWMLVDVEFIDEGLVTSVNDIVTEITYSFIASDYKQLDQQTFYAMVDPNQWINYMEPASVDELKASSVRARLADQGQMVA